MKNGRITAAVWDVHVDRIFPAVVSFDIDPDERPVVATSLDAARWAVTRPGVLVMGGSRLYSRGRGKFAVLHNRKTVLTMRITRAFRVYWDARDQEWKEIV